MNTLRKMDCLFTALVLATFALPAMAQGPAKKFSINLTLTGSSITAVFKNETPNGNSSFNSIKLIAPTGWTIPAQTISVPSGTAIVAGGGARVDVSNMSPVKPGQSFTFTFTVSPPAGGCTSGNWSGEAWSGSSFSGDSFAFQSAPLSNVTTGISSGCTLRFVPGREPQDAVVSAAITSTDNNTPAGSSVAVELVDSGNVRVTFGSGTVTLAKTVGSGAGALSGASATMAAGLAQFPALSINAIGPYRLTASLGAITSAASPPFTIFEAFLGCGASRTEVSGGNTTTIKREPNKDSSACENVGFNVLFTAADQTVQVEWDEGAYPNVVLRTTTTWPIEPLSQPPPANSWPKRTKVAWLTDGDGEPVFIEAQACITSDLPTGPTGGTLTTLPLLPGGVSAPYVAGEQARACIIAEAIETQPSSVCASGCVIVESEMYIVGDPWLSRQ